MAKRRPTKVQDQRDPANKRSRILQTDIPSFSLTQAVRVPQVVSDQFAGRPATPLQVAQGLNVQPTSGPFRMLCGAASAYGLTEGGYNAERIALTAIGRRIVMPTQEGDDARAIREALLKPRVIREFLQRYDQAKIPRDDIARNVLAEMGVPRDSVDRTLKLIVDGAKTVGFVRELNGISYIDLQGTPVESQRPR